MDDTTAIAPVEAPTPLPLAVVVFGRDEQGGKPHASRFDAAEAALAERAAGLMGLRALRLATAEQQLLGAKLAAGRIFATGRAFVPFVAAAVFAQLDADPAAFSPERSAGAEVPPVAPRKAKGGRSAGQAAPGALGGQEGASERLVALADRAAIAVGHRVLAAELNEPEFWYLAEVTALKGPDMLQLRWVSAQYANEPPFVRHREHLALLPPALASVAR